MNVDELANEIAEKYAKGVYWRSCSICKDVDREGLKLNYAAAIREAILETRKAQWIPVSERLPETPDNTKAATGTMVLVDVVYRVVPAYFEADREFHWLAGGIIHSITHWMPLPSPPAAETSAVEGK